MHRSAVARSSASSAALTRAWDPHGSVWRFEAQLPRAGLETDLVLSVATQSEIDNWIRASSFTNPPCTVVTSIAQRGDVKHASVPVVLWLMLIAAGLAGSRRLRRG